MVMQGPGQQEVKKIHDEGENMKSEKDVGGVPASNRSLCHLYNGEVLGRIENG